MIAPRNAVCALTCPIHSSANPSADRDADDDRARHQRELAHAAEVQHHDEPDAGITRSAVLTMSSRIAATSVSAVGIEPV